LQQKLQPLSYVKLTAHLNHIFIPKMLPSYSHYRLP